MKIIIIDYEKAGFNREKHYKYIRTYTKRAGYGLPTEYASDAEATPCVMVNHNAWYRNTTTETVRFKFRSGPWFDLCPTDLKDSEEYINALEIEEGLRNPPGPLDNCETLEEMRAVVFGR